MEVAIYFHSKRMILKTIHCSFISTKLSNELMAYSYSKLYGIKTIGLRFFTVYGPWGRPDMAYFSFAEKK